MGQYRSEATSVAGFIQQLGVQYVARGYLFYVVGQVPEGKDPLTVDDKLMGRYEVNLSRWARARRKRHGLANVHYLRFDRFFVLIASKGRHRFFSWEGKEVRDIRRDALQFAGHSIGYKQGFDGRFRVSIRIAPKKYLEVRDYLLDRAARASREELECEFRGLPFQPYAPVQLQLVSLLRKVNERRAMAGLPRLSQSCLRLVRRQVRPFGEEGRSVASGERAVPAPSYSD